MERFAPLLEIDEERGLAFCAGVQIVVHCHHFNLFHDQTIDDALGEERAFALKERAAHGAARQLLGAAADALGATTRTERAELATELFAWLGHGRLDLDVSGRRARGEPLHYSWAWRQKYGSRVARTHPLDAFAAGWSAAAIERVEGLEAGSAIGRETACHACRQPECRLEIEVSEPTPETVPPPPVDREALRPHFGPSEAGVRDDEMTEIARALSPLGRALEPDAQGLMQGFGVLLTRHLVEYYNRTAFDTLLTVERERPQMAELVESLLSESGHVCAFYTLGNLLLSPEWEAMVGRPGAVDAGTRVAWCFAAMRALGFGRTTIVELTDRRLVARTGSSYEAPFYLARYGRSSTPRCYLVASAAQAIMGLAHGVDWSSGATLDDALYQRLFGGGSPWLVEITRCLTRGEDACEVVVTRE